MNSIILGLAALSNLTGVRSGTQYAESSYMIEKNFKQRVLESCKANVTIVESSDLYNLRGENIYSLLEYSNGEYAVYDKESKTIIKHISSNPYEKYNGELKIFFDKYETNCFAYYDIENNSFNYSSNGKQIDLHRLASFPGESHKKDNYYQLDIPSDATKISNIWYFEKLRDNFSYNQNGSCTIVATSIYLGYLDTFYNDDVVHENYDVRSEESLFGKDFDIQSFEKSPGSDDKANCFHDYLVRICKNELNAEPGKMGAVKMKSLVKKELERHGVNYSYTCCDGNLSDVWGDRCKKIIKEGIDNNRAVLVSGQTHSTVAVAYNKDLVWVHAGWHPGSTEPVLRATPWSTFKVLYGFAMDVNQISRNHSDNYYDTNTRTYMSPDGFLEQRSELNPCHMWFPDDFNPEYVQQAIGSYNLNMQVGFKNAKSYPSEVMLTLKHDKEGEKDGLVEIMTYKNFHKIEFKYDYTYMSNTIQNRHGISLIFSALRRNPANNTYTWIDSRDIMDRNQFGKLRFTYECGDNIIGFKLELTKNTNGVSKDGQMSITEIKVAHDFDTYL